MSAGSTVGCPKCGTVLDPRGVRPGQVVQCGACGTQFPLDDPLAPAGTSGMAVTSFVLGLASIVGLCLTGVPAIIFGMLALGDIRRSGGVLKGHGLAVTGILMGTVCGVLCLPPIVGGTYLVMNAVQNINLSADPADVAEVASSIAAYTVPEGLEPLGGGGIFGFRGVMYMDDKENPGTILMLMQFPAWIGMTPDQMEQQMRGQLRNAGGQAVAAQQTRQFEVTVRGEPVQVTTTSGVQGQGGDAQRQYIALLPDDAGPIMVMLITLDQPKPAEEPAGPPKRLSMTEEQVREFFESFE